MIIQQWVDRLLNQNPGWLGNKKGMNEILPSFTQFYRDYNKYNKPI